MSKPNPRSLQSAGRSRTQRMARAAGLSLVVLGLLPCFAFAVHVVDVRVGQHKGYTRLVFELDEPTGYRIAREGKTPRSSRFDISLDAVTQPSRFSFPDGWIEKLDVQAVDDQVAASVALRKPGLRLREMTLDKPFRVVIDVLAPPTPPVAKKPEPKKEGAVVSATKSTPAPRRVPAAKTPPVQEADPKPAAKAPTAKSPPVAKAPVVKVAAPVLSRTKTPAPPTKKVAAAEAPSSARPETVADPTPPGPAVKSRPPAATVPTKSETLPSPKAPEPAEEEGSGWFYAYLALGSLLVVLAGVAAVASRGRKASEFDESAFDDLVPEPEASPFSVLAVEPSTEEKEVETSPEEEGFEIVEAAEQAVPLSGDVSDAVVELEPPVDTVADALPVLEGVPVEDPGEVGFQVQSSLATDEVARVLKEIESRLSALEGRLDEFVDWKSRVEKQIGAQTEELRVQRAAIARTQRAVRQMSRPEAVEPDPVSETSVDPSVSSES